jgi:hypothetical protein
MKDMSDVALAFFLALAGGAVIIAAALLAIVFFALLSPSPAHADPAQPPPQQPACFPPMRALELAREQYHELPVFSGADRSGARFVMTLNPESKSWSVFVCAANGTSCCVVGTGGDAIFPRNS